jgi:hypothetical protein
MTRWPIARYLLSTHFVFLMFVLLCFYAVCAVILGVAAALTDVTISTVDAAAQVLIWMALGYGASATGVLSTMMVHGRTRREFLVQHPFFQLVTTGTAAALITSAYAVETAVYRALDWGQKVQEHRVYESTSDYPVILAVYWCMLLTWMLVGVFVGAAFYRWEAAGALALLPAAAVVLINGSVTGFFSLPFTRIEVDGVLPVIGVTVVLVAVTAAMLWATVRDIPLKTRAA